MLRSDAPESEAPMSTPNTDRFQARVHAERILLMLPANVIMAARVTGTLNAGAVRIAVERLRARHALLAVRVQFDADGGARYVADGVPAVPLREVTAEPGSTAPRWLQEAIRESRTAFPLERGPLVRFVIVRGAEHTHLLVTGHHAICDGRSLTFLLRDVLQLVDRPDAEVEPLPPPTPITAATVDQPPRSNWLKRWVMRQLERRWNRRGVSFDAGDREQLHRAFWKRNTAPRALAWALDRVQTSALADRCRAEGVTVNSALWTALLAAQHEVQGDAEPFRRQVGMAVSTRERLQPPVGEALGFYASSLSLAPGYDPGLPFWDAARAVHRRIKRALARTDVFRMLAAGELPPTLLDALYPAKYGLLQDRMAARMLARMGWDRVSYGYSLTNVGRSDIPTRYGSHELEAVYGPFFYSDVNEKVVGVTTAAGSLTFTLTCDEAVVGRGVPERLREECEAQLQRALAPAADGAPAGALSASRTRA